MTTVCHNTKNKNKQKKSTQELEVSIGTVTSRAAKGAESQGMSVPPISVPFPFTVSAAFFPIEITALRRVVKALSSSLALKSYWRSPGAMVRLGIVPNPRAVPLRENEI